MTDVAGWLTALLVAAGVAPPTACAALAGGTYNTVLRVSTGDGPVIVKVAPDPAVPALTYERGIMSTEALYYRLAGAQGVTGLPRVIDRGWIDRGQFIGREALVLTVVPGRPWPDVVDDLTVAQRRAVRAEVGHTLAALHRLTSPGFGYPAGPLAPTWSDAFLGMLDALLADAGRFAVPLPRPAGAIAALAAARAEVLDQVDVPALVHFDLWDGNILVYGTRLGGLIDAERAFWGDPLAELVSLHLFDSDGVLDPALIEGYGLVALDEAARVRLRLYRLYLYLIMWVETVPRGFDATQLARRREQVYESIARLVDSLTRDR